MSIGLWSYRLEALKKVGLETINRLMKKSFKGGPTQPPSQRRVSPYNMTMVDLHRFLRDAVYCRAVFRRI
jgi:hypothetical protein